MVLEKVDGITQSTETLSKIKGRGRIHPLLFPARGLEWQHLLSPFLASELQLTQLAPLVLRYLDLNRNYQPS